MIDTSIRSLAVESNFSALRKNQEEPLFRLEPGRWGSNDFSVVWSFGGNYSVCVPLSSLRKRNEKETVAVSREKNRGGKEKETNERSGGVERNRWKGGERERGGEEWVREHNVGQDDGSSYNSDESSPRNNGSPFYSWSTPLFEDPRGWKDTPGPFDNRISTATVERRRRRRRRPFQPAICPRCSRGQVVLSPSVNFVGARMGAGGMKRGHTGVAANGANQAS